VRSDANSARRGRRDPRTTRRPGGRCTGENSLAIVLARNREYTKPRAGRLRLLKLRPGQQRTWCPTTATGDRPPRPAVLPTCAADRENLDEMGTSRTIRARNREPGTLLGRAPIFASAPKTASGFT